MVQSVELLVDDTMSDFVRGDWQTLIDAGLPSAGRHTGPSNRPHITVFAAPSLPAEREPALAPFAARLPLPLRLGGLVLFGRGEFVLARLVVPSADLLHFHADVVECIGPQLAVGHVRPGEWTAHVTLARRLKPSQVGEALGLLSGVRDFFGRATGLRRWDGDAKREWMVG